VWTFSSGRKYQCKVTPPSYNLIGSKFRRPALLGLGWYAYTPVVTGHGYDRIVPGQPCRCPSYLSSRNEQKCEVALENRRAGLMVSVAPRCEGKEVRLIHWQAPQSAYQCRSLFGHQAHPHGRTISWRGNKVPSDHLRFLAFLPRRPQARKESSSLALSVISGVNYRTAWLLSEQDHAGNERNVMAPMSSGKGAGGLMPTLGGRTLWWQGWSLIGEQGCPVVAAVSGRLRRATPVI